MGASPVQQAMLNAVPDRLMADIVNDQRRGVSPPSSLASTPGDPPPLPRGGTGWAQPAPLAPPPGVALCDAMMDAQDAKDRAERIDAAIDRAARMGMISKPAEGSVDAPRAPATRPTENTPPIQPATKGAA